MLQYEDFLSGFLGTFMLQVDALRLRLEEKESFLNKKTKQLQDLTEEKGTLAGEIRDMKDMLEVKERKINVLQKKVGVIFLFLQPLKNSELRKGHENVLSVFLALPFSAT